ncbi:MAG TPA: DUF4349 domain-containing protein [Anaerolineales bacterium]|jgi:hypothetical protein|nr:DUF4349 domain-containing protein [Anaerolineales bacterium]
MKRNVLVAIGITLIAVLVFALGFGAGHSKTAYNDALQVEQPGLYPVPAMGGAGAAPQESFAQSAPPYAPGYDAAKGVAPSDVTNNSVPSTDSDRLVVQNADLTIVVTDVRARVQAISAMAKQMGGFVVSANVYETYTRNGTQVSQAQVVFRVPVDQMDAALDQVKKDTVDVQNETRSSQDITSQYVDLQSQLTAKEAAEAQLLKIMQGAEKTEDVLAVYAQLQQIQSDIQVLKGQIKYDEESAALSSVSVNIIAEETIQPIKVGPWQPQGVARDAIQNLVDFWKGFAEWIINFFLFTLPALITIAIPLFLVYLLGRWLVRKFWKPKAAPIVEEVKKKK